jgi:DNA-binding PadR family transcriptional regulator
MQRKNSSYMIPRGILKSYILHLLEEKPQHGYALIQEIRKKTKFWQPSPGTIYPQLAALVREGAVKKRTEGRRLVYFLTNHGKKMARDISAVREELRKRSFETLVSILTEKDMTKLLDRFAKECYDEKESREVVAAANEFWIKVTKHFAHSTRGAKETRKLLEEMNRKFDKLLR